MSVQTRMRFETASETDDSVRVKVYGHVTQQGLSEGAEPLVDLIGGDVYGRTIRLDLEEAESIDSSGIGWLLGCHKRFREAGGHLKLCAVPPLIAQLLRVLRLDRIFPLDDDGRDTPATVAQEGIS